MVAGVRGGWPGSGWGGLGELLGSCASTSTYGWPWLGSAGLGGCRVASLVKGGLWGALVVSWRPTGGDGGRVRGAEWVSGRLGHARHGNG